MSLVSFGVKKDNLCIDDQDYLDYLNTQEKYSGNNLNVKKLFTSNSQLMLQHPQNELYVFTLNH